MFYFWHYKHHKKAINIDWVEVNKWAYQWKTSFNSGPSKYARGSNIEQIDNVSKTNSQKHLGFVFNNRPWFDEHLKMIINKVNKTIGLLRKLHKALRRSYQITLYKAFVRLHLDFGIIIYGQECNISFHQKFELIQYDACLAITRAIEDTS